MTNKVSIVGKFYEEYFLVNIISFVYFEEKCSFNVIFVYLSVGLCIHMTAFMWQQYTTKMLK